MEQSAGLVAERYIYYLASSSMVHLTMIVQSSLTLALLRCIVTEGMVLFDGMPSDTINLDALRSNITIIPQVVRYYLLLLLSQILVIDESCSLSSSAVL